MQPCSYFTSLPLILLTSSPPLAGLIDPEGFDDFRVVLGEGSLAAGKR